MSNLSNANTTISNMSQSELENEIINLRNINAAQVNKIEDYEQKLYELKRQLSTSKAMEEHLSAEIESLHRNDKSENDDYLKKISILEEEIHNLKKSNSESVEFYETELQAKEDKIDTLIDTAKNKTDTIVKLDTDEINKYTDEICNLKLKLDELSEQLVECETKNQELSVKNTALENQITELSSQLGEVKDCLQVKREELEECKDSVQNLQDERIFMQMEIDKYKAVPLETAAKGNSLFAEVDDNRVKLQKTLESMKKRYIQMKTQYSSKCQELQKLHMQYAELTKVVADKNETTEEKSELEKTYKRHFNQLNENIKSLENELIVQKNAFTKLISKDWKCAQEMISVTREELQDLQRKLNAESLSLITSESNHYKTKRELKKWQAEAMQLRTQIVSLNQTIEEMKLLKSPTEFSSDSTTTYKKSCLKKTPGPIFTKIDDWEPSDELKNQDIDITTFSELTMVNFSIFDTTSANPEDNLDELKCITQPEDKESNKENTLSENSNITMNDTMSGLTSKIRKVSFEENTSESSNTTKLGGRKIIKAQPIHIPSIKRN